MGTILDISGERLHGRVDFSKSPTWNVLGSEIVSWGTFPAVENSPGGLFQVEDDLGHYTGTTAEWYLDDTKQVKLKTGFC